jgi:hypothetical protein
MQRIRIERKAPVRRDPDRYAPLPLDPRDPDILRAKQLIYGGNGGTSCERGESNPHALSGTGS